MRIIIITFLLVFALFGAKNDKQVDECTNKLFSLNAYSTHKAGLSIEDVLRDLSVRCRITLKFEDEKSKKAIKKKLDFVNIKNYTFDEFIKFLFDEANLFYDFDKRKGIIKISYYKSKTFSIDYINVSELSSESSKSINTGSGSSTSSNTNSGTSTGSTSDESSGTSADYTKITTKSDFTFWNSLKNNIQNILSSSNDYKLFINKDASLLTITANRKDLEKVSKFLKTIMSKMHKQVLIEAKIIEVTYSDGHKNGIDWSKFNLSIKGNLNSSKSRTAGYVAGSLTDPDYYIGYNFSIDGLLNFLKSYGDVKILSNPKVLTLNNQPAVINVGQQLSYKYQTGTITTTTTGNPVGSATYNVGSTFIGITLYVIPEVTSTGDIIMKINPVISDLSGASANTNVVRELPPDIKIKQMTSIVKVKDGQKVLIGGLISSIKSKSHNKVPILGDIPILGGAFHSTENEIKNSELFILLIPKIVKSSNMPTIDELKILKGRFE